jgi:hypothetical protein
MAAAADEQDGTDGSGLERPHRSRTQRPGTESTGDVSREARSGRIASDHDISFGQILRDVDAKLSHLDGLQTEVTVEST